MEDPDRYAYYSNVAGTAYDGKKPSDVDPNWPQGRIYRQDLSKPGSDPEPFFDLTKLYLLASLLGDGLFQL